jgi:diadenosine tetraphosphate (Ap4A) HIT family hydrolase
MCMFCDLGGTDAPVNEAYFWARLDINPVSPGHMLVVPKRHIESLDQLTWNEWCALRRARQLAIEYIESQDAESFAGIYKAMAEAKATPNSEYFAKFAKMALGHGLLGGKPHGYNEGVNRGSAAGQTVGHLHWHIIPRYDGDMEDPSGGIRYAIPTMGNYHKPRG